MESIGHTHTHSGRNFHSYGTTVLRAPGRGTPHQSNSLHAHVPTNCLLVHWWVLSPAGMNRGGGGGVTFKTTHPLAQIDGATISRISVVGKDVALLP